MHGCMMVNAIRYLHWDRCVVPGVTRALHPGALVAVTKLATARTTTSIALPVSTDSGAQLHNRAINHSGIYMG